MKPISKKNKKALKTNLGVAATKTIPERDIAAAPTPSSDAPELPKNELRKKAFLDLAVERSGIKKKDAKPAIEATLAVLSEALIDGKEVNLPPLGKFKVNRIKDLPNAKVLVVKLRIPNQMGVATPDVTGELN